MPMRKCYIGVDPGAKGYLCAIYHTGEYFYAPLADQIMLKNLLLNIRCNHDEYIAVVENVHALPKQGLSTTFTFGYNVGWINGVLWASGIPTTSVSPNKWQREMWDSRDIVKTGGKTDAKKTSLNAAIRLHPDADFRRTERSKKADDNIVDSTLIADYAKRLQL